MQSSPTLLKLQQPVEEPMRQFRQLYRQRIPADTPLLAEVDQYLLQCPGKQLRPLLLLLSAQVCGGVHREHLLLAVAVEMLHNATLMHDDVVDEADQRRGRPSVRSRWNNQTAVLCGDYYLAQVMSLLQEVNLPQATAWVCNTVSTMCRGELLQLGMVANGATSVEDYLRVIENKTAQLMASCCQLGAIAATPAPPSHYGKALYRFGLHYGMLYQLRDDMGSLATGHDATLPTGTNPQPLMAEHARLAAEALQALPLSPAHTALLTLLSPQAPGPD